MAETTRSNLSLSAAIGNWVRGWSMSRRTVAPVEIPGGFYIDVGTATETGRFVLSVRDDAGRIREVAARVSTPNIWIKLPGIGSELAPLLGQGWKLGQELSLMGRSLEYLPPTAIPAGYSLEVVDEGNALEARVVTVDGVLAARGRVGLSRVAVPDQIVTEVAHRRRGLGNIVMRTLSNAALDRRRTDAILVASGQGRALYETLGWRVIAPFAEAQFTAAGLSPTDGI